MIEEINGIISNMKNELPKEKFNSEVVNLFESMKAVVYFLRDWVPTYVGNTECESYKNVVFAMENINLCANKYGYKNIMNFDKNNWRTVLKCASDFSESSFEFFMNESGDFDELSTTRL